MDQALKRLMSSTTQAQLRSDHTMLTETVFHSPTLKKLATRLKGKKKGQIEKDSNNSVVHPVTSHSQWNWWVRKRAIHNSIENPLVGCLREMDPIPANPNPRILARFRDHNFFATHFNLGPAFESLVVVVLSTMPTTDLKRVHEACKAHLIICKPTPNVIQL